MVERAVQHPLQPDVPADPLTGDGPGVDARERARTGLYVHVPFCAVRCTYCHFSTATFEAGLLDRWLDAIEREAALRAPAAAGVAFSSLFFGGGTPSQLSARHFARLRAMLSAHFTLEPDAEVTLEANPESVRPALLDAWRAGGVNRLSLGAQSFEPGELATLGRMHDEHRPAQAIALARAHGFSRLSLDLMFGYPGHTLATFERTLAMAFAQPIEHLSAYSFIADRGTPLGDAVHDGRRHVADDEQQAQMYDAFHAASARAGMRLYETSNVARPGAEARHNLTYWLRRDYLALGPSAHGLWRGERFANLWGTHEWADALAAGRSPETERERPGEAAIAEEILMLGLRLGSGLRLADYPTAEQESFARRYGAALEAAVAERRLERTADGWRVAPAHRFVADDVIAWVAARGA
jgi:oxygen-independent coproporphyrinogen-3 oxidase